MKPAPAVRPVEILTPRLTLRPVDMSFLASTHAYASDPENTKYMMYLPYASLEETAAAIRFSEAEWKKAEPEQCDFAVLLNGTHIGGVTLYFLDNRAEAELGWVLNRAYWGRGYAGEAAGALIDFARDAWGIRRVIACCDSENVASRRVMEKLGMRRVRCAGGRKNRSSDEERMEFLYEKLL